MRGPEQMGFNNPAIAESPEASLIPDRKFNQELTILNALVLSNNLIKDANAVYEAQDPSRDPKWDDMMKRGNKDEMRKCLREWIAGIDARLSGGGETDQRVAPGKVSPVHEALLAKKRELLNKILESSN